LLSPILITSILDESKSWPTDDSPIMAEQTFHFYRKLQNLNRFVKMSWTREEEKNNTYKFFLSFLISSRRKQKVICFVSLWFRWSCWRWLCCICFIHYSSKSRSKCSKKWFNIWHRTVKISPLAQVLNSLFTLQSLFWSRWTVCMHVKGEEISLKTDFWKQLFLLDGKP
jgi:hypothetical protein